MSFEVRNYYVLGRLTDGTHWVLGSYYSEHDAKRSIAWQNVGQPCPVVWKICTHQHGGDFYPVTGGKIDFPLRPFPYTKEAYAKFMADHGIDPKHMTPNS